MPWAPLAALESGVEWFWAFTQAGGSLTRLCPGLSYLALSGLQSALTRGEICEDGLEEIDALGSPGCARKWCGMVLGVYPGRRLADSPLPWAIISCPFRA